MSRQLDTHARAQRFATLSWLAGSLTWVSLCVLPTLHFGLLAWDDAFHVTNNVAVTRPSAAGWRTLLLTPQLGYPIPVTVASYALDHWVFGPGAYGFHLSQLFYQLAVCAVYFGMSRSIGLSNAASALALGCFALHPATAEPVSWISGRKDVLAALWGLASVWLAGAGSRRARVGSVICYALALLSKPSAAPIAALAVLAPHVFARTRALSVEAGPAPGGTALRAMVVRGVPYALVLAPIAALGVIGQAQVGGIGDAADVLPRWHAIWYALGHHLSVLFLWEETTAKYLPAVWPPAFTPRVDLAPLLWLSLVTAAVLITRARPQLRRVVGFGVAWAVLAYLPSSGLLFHLTRYLADSYLYLPLLGAGWVLGAVLDAAGAALRPRYRAALRLSPVLFALALMPSFLSSSARFASDERLWTHALARFPHHRRVCRQWANAVAAARGPGAGLRATDACIARFGPALFVHNRAVLLRRLGRDAEAHAWLRAERLAREPEP